MSEKKIGGTRLLGRWQRAFAAAVAVWIFFSPTLLPALASGVMAGGRNDLAIWNAWIAGAVLALVSLAELAVHRGWHLWSIAAIGLWVGASPWILDFRAPVPRLNATIAGAFLALCATSMLLQTSGAPQALGRGVTDLCRKLGFRNKPRETVTVPGTNAGP